MLTGTYAQRPSSTTWPLVASVATLPKNDLSKISESYLRSGSDHGQGRGWESGLGVCVVVEESETYQLLIEPLSEAACASMVKSQ